MNLFEPDLQHQGSGRFADIRAGDYDSLLSVPYWAWSQHVDEVTSLLSSHKKKIDAIKRMKALAAAKKAGKKLKLAVAARK